MTTYSYATENHTLRWNLKKKKKKKIIKFHI